MMKKEYLFIFMLLGALLFAGCSNEELSVSTPTTGKGTTFKIRASMPIENNNGTRVSASQAVGSKEIVLRWKRDDKIHIYFKQNEKIIDGGEVEAQNISTDGRRAEFDIAIPVGENAINTELPFDLFGAHDVESTVSEEGKILLDARPTKLYLGLQRLEDIPVPIYFKVESPTSADELDVVFKHYGALQVVTIKNTSDNRINEASFEQVEEGLELGYFLPDPHNNMLAFDMITEGVVSSTNLNLFKTKMDIEEPPTVTFSDNVKMAQWIFPNGEVPDGLKIGGYIEYNRIETTTTKERTSPLQAGRAYELYVLWDGEELTFSDEATTAPASITFTTSKGKGEYIRFLIDTKEKFKGDVWYDLNNDGIKQENEGSPQFGDFSCIEIVSQTITIYGRLTEFNPLEYCTGLDLSKSPDLEILRYGDSSNQGINVTGLNTLSKLKELRCDNMKLETLNLDGLTSLEILYCPWNNLEKLDVSKLNKLKTLICFDNKLTQLDVTNNTKLTHLDCADNNIGTDKMTTLIESLPDLSNNELPSPPGQFVVKSYSSSQKCTTAQVKSAVDKNWKVLNILGDDYDGED